MTSFRLNCFFIVNFLFFFSGSLCASSRSTEIIQKIDTWQLGEAREDFKSWTREEKESQEGLFVQSYLQFHLADFESANTFYLRALQSGFPGDAAYEKVLTDTRKLTYSYLRKESAHFLVLYPPGKDSILAERALLVLEKIWNTIGQDFGFYLAAEEKIPVLIVPDAPGLAAVSTLKTHEIENSGTIAICKFDRLMLTSPLATYYGYSWADTLAHEFIHLVINHLTHARVPIWLHEGLAKWMETRWNGSPGRALDPSSVQLLVKAARNNQWIRFEEMHPSMAKLPNQEASGLAFAEVFIAVSLLYEKQGVDTLRKLLAQIDKGVSIEQSITSVYGKPFSLFTQDWMNKLKKFKNKSRYTGFSAEKIQWKSAQKNVFELEKEPDARDRIQEKKVQDFAKLGEYLHAKSRPLAARIEYEKAYMLSKQPYPSLMNLYARSLIETGQTEKAIPILENLLQLNHDHVEAHLKLARIALSQHRLVSAREHFEAASLVQPYHPEIYTGLIQADPENTANYKRYLHILGVYENEK